jgi:hypothetical protein
VRNRGFTEREEHWNGYRIGFADGRIAEARERNERIKKAWTHVAFMVIFIATMVAFVFAGEYLTR